MQDKSVDAEVLEYLDAVESYKEQLECATEHLRTGFIEIAHSRQTGPVGSTQFDLTAQATLVLDKLVVEKRAGSDPILQFGAWPPSSLKLAQAEFSTAIEALIGAAKSRHEATELGNVLDKKKQDHAMSSC